MLRKSSVCKFGAIYALFLACFVPATTTAICIWCTKTTSHKFVNCIYKQFNSSEIFETKQLDAMKESMIAASSSIKNMPSTLIMEIMNGVMAGEMAALHKSCSSSSPQDARAIHKYITDIVIKCYSNVSNVQQPDDFTEAFNTALGPLIKVTGSAAVKPSEVTSSTAAASPSSTDGNHPVLIIDPPKPTTKDMFFKYLFKVLSQEVFQIIFSTDISNDRACSILLQVLIETLNYIHNSTYSQYSVEIANACIAAIKSKTDNCPAEKYGEIIAKCLMEQFHEKKLITDHCDTQATDLGIAILTLLAIWKFHETLYQQILLSEYYQYIFPSSISISDAKLLATNLIIRCLTGDYGDNIANEVANECEKRFTSVYYSSKSFDAAKIITGSIAYVFHIYGIPSPKTAHQQAMNIASRINSCFHQFIIEAQHQQPAFKVPSSLASSKNPTASNGSATLDGSVVSVHTASSSTSADLVSPPLSAFSKLPNSFYPQHMKLPLNYPPNVPQYQIQNVYPTETGEATSEALKTDSRTKTDAANRDNKYGLLYRTQIRPETVFYQNAPNRNFFSKTEAFNADTSNNNKLHVINSPATSSTAKARSTDVKSSEVTSSTAAAPTSGTGGNVMRPVLMVDPPKPTTKDVFFECLFKLLSQEVFKKIFSTDISNKEACSILLQVLAQALNNPRNNNRYSQYSGEMAEACIVAIKSQPNNYPTEKYGEIIAKCFTEQFYENKLISDNSDTQATDIGIAILSLLSTWKFHETLYQQILLSEYYHYIFTAAIPIADAKLLVTNLIIRCLTVDYGDNMAKEVANECEKRFTSVYYSSKSFDAAKIIAESIAHVFHICDILSPYTALQHAINISFKINSCLSQLIIEIQHQQHASPADSVSTALEASDSSASSDGLVASNVSAASDSSVVSTDSDGSAVSNVSAASDDPIVYAVSANFASSKELKHQKNEKEAPTKSSTTFKDSSLSVASVPAGGSTISEDSVTPSSSVTSTDSDTAVSSPGPKHKKIKKKIKKHVSTEPSTTSEASAVSAHSATVTDSVTPSTSASITGSEHKKPKKTSIVTSKTSSVSIVSAGGSTTSDDSETSSSVGSADSETAASSRGLKHQSPTEHLTTSVASAVSEPSASVTDSVTSSTSGSITRSQHRKNIKNFTGTSKTSASDVSASADGLDSLTTSEASGESAASVSSEVSKSLAASEAADHLATSADSDSSSGSVVSAASVASADSETSVSTTESYHKNIPNQEKSFTKTCSDSNERIKVIMKYTLLSISNGKFNYESLSRIISYLVKYMQNTNPDICPQKIILRVLIETIMACTQLLVKVPSQYLKNVEGINTNSSCFKEFISEYFDQ